MTSAVWRDLARRAFFTNGAIWLAVFALFGLFGRRLGLAELIIFDPLILFLSVPFLGHMIVLNQGPVAFWRRQSGTIATFWAGIAGALGVQLILAAVLATAFGLALGSGAEAWRFVSGADVAWGTLIFASILLASTHDRAEALRATPRPGRTTAAILGVYAYVSVVATVYLGISPTLGYVVAEFGAIGLFSAWNPMVRRSLTRAWRLRVAMIGVTATVLMGGLSYVGWERRRARATPCPRDELAAVTTPVAWSTCASRVDHGDTRLALDRLETICPPLSTDLASTITCVTTDELAPKRIKGSFDEAEIRAELNAPGVYVKMLGVVSARRLQTLPPDVASRLADIAKLPGPLGVLAQATLSGTNPKRDELRVEFVRPAPAGASRESTR